jgi:hypothetical protein
MAFPIISIALNVPSTPWRQLVVIAVAKSSATVLKRVENSFAAPIALTKKESPLFTTVLENGSAAPPGICPPHPWVYAMGRAFCFSKRSLGTMGNPE